MPGSPTASMLSFTRTGIPWSGPRICPAARSASSRAACSRASGANASTARRWTGPGPSTAAMRSSRAWVSSTDVVRPAARSAASPYAVAVATGRVDGCGSWGTRRVFQSWLTAATELGTRAARRTPVDLVPYRRAGGRWTLWVGPSGEPATGCGVVTMRESATSRPPSRDDVRAPGGWARGPVTGFADRHEAGRLLAAALGHLRGADVVVVGLPRGGVPVAYEVACALGAPLDVIVVRKLGVPSQPELAMGAIGEDGVRVVNDDVVRHTGVSAAGLAAVEARERTELARRALLFRSGRRRIALAGRVVVVVDDGVATGSTAAAACRVARAEGARRVILAVPVAPTEWAERLAGAADELVCLLNPHPFFGVGQFYDDFSQTSDAEVAACLERAADRPSAEPARDEEIAGRHRSAAAGRPPHRPFGGLRPGAVRARQRQQPAEPTQPLRGVGAQRGRTRHPAVRPAHDRRGGRPRQRVRHRAAGGPAGRRDAPPRRRSRPRPAPDRPVRGQHRGGCRAVGGRRAGGGRRRGRVAGWAPRSRGPRLREVRAPTLLIVGGHDTQVLDLNRQAQARLRCESRLEIVPGATHLFEEPGTLQAAARLARDWFLRHLGDPETSEASR